MWLVFMYNCYGCCTHMVTHVGFKQPGTIKNGNKLEYPGWRVVAYARARYLFTVNAPICFTLKENAGVAR
jgi:hypothetical protein